MRNSGGAAAAGGAKVDAVSGHAGTSERASQMGGSAWPSGTSGRPEFSEFVDRRGECRGDRGAASGAGSGRLADDVQDQTAVDEAGQGLVRSTNLQAWKPFRSSSICSGL